MHNQDNQRPTGCSDCGAFPTTAGHRCPPTTPVELEQLVDDLEARARAELQTTDRDGSEQPLGKSRPSGYVTFTIELERLRKLRAAEAARAAVLQHYLEESEQAADRLEAALNKMRERRDRWRERAELAQREVELLVRHNTDVTVERNELARRLSALLCELTGGRLSKPTYDVPTMITEIDSAYDDAQQQDRAERDRLAAMLADPWSLEGNAAAMAWKAKYDAAEATLAQVGERLTAIVPALTAILGAEANARCDR